MTGPTFDERLHAGWTKRRTMLCVGLDPEPDRLPGAWVGRVDRIGEFCRAIVDVTADLVCAFKPQIAYFAAHGAEDQLEAVINHIRAVAPEVPVILDAKRGDIGSTAEQYAREAFDRYGADAVTVNPYLGLDTIEPFAVHAARAGGGLFVLCRTSNPGSGDFQDLIVDGEPLYQRVARAVVQQFDVAGLVVGATYPEQLAAVRAIAPATPILVPGVGAQGGDLLGAVQAGATAAGGLVVSSSRAVLYASSGADFAGAARQVASDAREAIEAARQLV